MRVMAATSHPLATLTALDVLRRGGNAMDAAVAAIALLGVVEATQTGIGGDCFVLYMRRGEGEIIALNGSGWAPAAASLDRYVSRGMRWIPSDSADAVIDEQLAHYRNLKAEVEWKVYAHDGPADANRSISDWKRAAPYGRAGGAS